MEINFCDHGRLMPFWHRLPFVTPSFLVVVLQTLVLFMGLQDFIPGSPWRLLLNVGDSFSLP